MAATYGNPAPLTEQHLTMINEALRNIHDARKIIDKAVAAGMDMSGHTQSADQMEQALTAFKQQFFMPARKGE
jgi:hypothetical protein